MATTLSFLKIRSVNFASRYIKFAYNYIILYIQTLSGRISCKKEKRQSNPCRLHSACCFPFTCSGAQLLQSSGEALPAIRVLRVLKDSGNNLRNIGRLVVLSRSNLQTGIFIAGQQRRKAAGILSAGSVVDESCNELVTDQIVDDDVKEFFANSGFSGSRSAISMISARFNGRAGLPKELHHRKFGIR